MVDSEPTRGEQPGIRTAVEAAIRIGLIGLMLLWVFDIVSPFIGPLVWGAVIAVAVAAPYRWLTRRCAQRRTLAASLLVLALLAALMTPMLWLTSATVDWGQGMATEVSDGKLEIPKPPDRVREWPLVGERIYGLWELSATNLQATLARAEDQLKALGVWLLKSAATAGLGVLQFAFAIVISGVFLVHTAGITEVIDRFAARLAPVNGLRYRVLAENTIRGVATGVVGVAVIQCVLAAVALFAVGVPGAGAIAFACLLVAIVQLPLAIPILPVLIYVWMVEPTLTAVLFTLWMVPVTMLDNVLKPILMGRGVEAPTLVIFVGAIGGMATSGIVGLFTGAVVLVVAFELFRAWLEAEQRSQESADTV